MLNPASEHCTCVTTNFEILTTYQNWVRSKDKWLVSTWFRLQMQLPSMVLQQWWLKGNSIAQRTWSRLSYHHSAQHQSSAYLTVCACAHVLNNLTMLCIYMQDWKVVSHYSQIVWAILADGSRCFSWVYVLIFYYTSVLTGFVHHITSHLLRCWMPGDILQRCYFTVVWTVGI